VSGENSGCITGLRREDLDLSATLRSGQVFRWTQDADHVWHGVLENQRIARLQQSADSAGIWWEADGPDAEAAIRSFLRLGPQEPDLTALAETWCREDALFAEAWARNPGIRVLRQDPGECFFAFLCASVAPIARISGMLRAVAGELGTPLRPGEITEGYYTLFPSASQIAAASEERLRELGLGFRARRVMEASRTLIQLPPGHLAVLRHGATYDEAKKELTAFFGVGEKIADCVCLFALDKDGAIPVDTHIWRIAVTRYAPDLAGKSLTAANYARVTQAFHDRFGPLAGWAQQTLFFRSAVGRQRP
jgi:N-glycosylase/DNA lyase